MSRIRQLQISVTNNFLIFHITGQFWDCWKVSVSFFFFEFFFSSLFIYFCLFFFLFSVEKERERDLPWARDNRCTWHERRTFVVIYYTCNLETVGPGLTHCVYCGTGVRVPSDVRLSCNNFLYDEWTSCARDLRGWLIVVEVRMIHCCEILFATGYVVLFQELRGLIRGIFKLESLVFRVKLLV